MNNWIRFLLFFAIVLGIELVAPAAIGMRPGDRLITAFAVALFLISLFGNKGRRSHQ